MGELNQTNRTPGRAGGVETYKNKKSYKLLSGGSPTVVLKQVLFSVVNFNPPRKLPDRQADWQSSWTANSYFSSGQNWENGLKGESRD